MRVLSSTLNAGSRALTWATCTRITRRDGTEETYTDHNRDITIDAETFLAASGYTHAALRLNATWEPGQVQIQGPMHINGLDPVLLRHGAYDHAYFEMFLVNWTNPALTDALLVGWFSEVQMSSAEEFSVQVRGLLSMLHQTSVVEMLAPYCRADLGDARCGVDLTALTVSGTATAPFGALRRAFEGSAVPVLAGGRLTWDTGNNAGLSSVIKSIAGNVIILYTAMPYQISVGDTYIAEPGCDKSLETCGGTYANVVNMRAEPYAPTNAWLFFSPPIFNPSTS